MTGINVSAISPLISAAVATAGLIFAAFQFRGLSRSISGNSSAQVYTYMRELLQLQIMHPELRPYINSEKGPPVDGIEGEKLASFLEQFADFIEFVLVQRRIGALTSKEYEDTWKSYFQGVLAQSTYLRNFILDNKGCYAPDVEELARAAGVATIAISPRPKTVT